MTECGDVRDPMRVIRRLSAALAGFGRPGDARYGQRFSASQAGIGGSFDST
jgi:hypothetical protein